MEIIQLKKPNAVRKFYIQLIHSEFTHDHAPLGTLVKEVVYTNDEERCWRGRKLASAHN